MERRALLAAVLCLVVLVAYQTAVQYLYPPPPPGAEPEVTATAAPRPRPSAVGEPASAPELMDQPARAVVAPAPGPLITIETPLYSAQVASTGGRLVSLRLKRYRTSVDPNSGPLELVEVGQDAAPPLGVRFVGSSGATLDDTEVAYAANPPGDITVDADGKATLTLTGVLPSGARIEKTLTFVGSGYPIEVLVRAPELPASFVRVGVGWRHQAVDDGRGQEARYRGAMVLAGKKLVHLLSTKLAKESAQTFDSPVAWAGYTDHYFLAALIPDQPDEARAVVAGADGVEVFLSEQRVEPDGARFSVYAGPKDVSVLQGVDHGLERAVYFGWFSFLAVPLIRLLNVFHSATGNYGVDVILLTILVKVLFIPLTTKSMKSMREMQRIQPQMAKLREKYKDDRERLNKEMIELYRRHRVNPLGGCLPMVLQFPVFLGLYQGLYGAIELRHARFALWVRDLSTNECYPWPGHTTLVGCNNFSVLGTPVPVLVLLMGVSMLLQQWLTPSSGMDPAQQRIMMVVMPVMFTVMFVTFPTGLVLYWLVNNVLTIGQQWWMNRARA
jgi:YidC/Oxa1 family membrane protein insertase